MDSIPLIAITGQVPQAMIGKGRVSGDRFLRDDFACGQAQLLDHRHRGYSARGEGGVSHCDNRPTRAGGH